MSWDVTLMLMSCCLAICLCCIYLLDYLSVINLNKMLYLRYIVAVASRLWCCVHVSSHILFYPSPIYSTFAFRFDMSYLIG